MLIYSHNINGIRARVTAGLVPDLQMRDADIVCLQEVRADNNQIPFQFKQAFPDYDLSIHNHKRGYAGVLTISKEPPTSAIELEFAGQTGRALQTDYKDFSVINVYIPNSGSNLERLNIRVQWMTEFTKYMRDVTKPTIIIGDFNVLPSDIDTNRKNVIVGRTKEERQCYQDLKFLGFVDIWRNLHPNVQDFTWYSAQHKGREAHRGDRNDICLIDGRLYEKVKTCEILHDYHANSDHTPLLLSIDI